jgi:hypothetical protein
MICNRDCAFKTYVASSVLLLRVLDTVELVDTRAVGAGVAAESNVKSLEELVAAGEQRLGRLRARVDGGLTVEDDDAVGEVSGHDEIVLDDEGGLLGVHDEALDDARGDDTLLRVEVGGRLVDDVDVGGHAEGEHNGDTLQLTTRQVLDFLVDEVVHLERLVDVGLELGVDEGGLDALEEELADGALELGRDLLRLHRDVHGRDLLVAVGLEGTCKHLTECRLTSTVLTHHDQNLRSSESTGLNLEVEVAHRLLHGRVGEALSLVDEEVLARITDAELQRLVAETQVLGGNVTVEENVDTFAHGEGGGDHTVDGGLSVENADVVGQVVEDRQIVLDDDDVAVGSEQAADQTTGGETLLDIQKGGRLVEHVDVGLLHADHADGETLQLTTGEEVNVTVPDNVEFWRIVSIPEVSNSRWENAPRVSLISLSLSWLTSHRVVIRLPTDLSTFSLSALGI